MHVWCKHQPLLTVRHLPAQSVIIGTLRIGQRGNTDVNTGHAVYLDHRCPYV